MKPSLRWSVIILAILALLILSLPFLIDANHFRPLLESKLSAALNRPVHLGDLQLSLISGNVTASDLAIADDPAFRHDPFVRAASLQIGVELMPLIFHRKLNVTALTIDRPEIVLAQNAAGAWNFSSLGTKSAPKPDADASSKLALSVRQVKVSNGRLTLGPRTLEKLDLDLRDFSATKSFPFSISAHDTAGAEIHLQGKAGPINAGDATHTPLDTSFTFTQSGVASLDSTARSDGNILDLKGRFTFAKLKLVLDCAVRHDLTRHAGTLTQGDLRIGKAAATLGGTYSVLGEKPAIHLQLSGSNMPLPELVALVVLPAGSSIQGGVATVNLAADGPLDGLTSAADVKVENARLVGFDLGSKMSTIERLAGIKTGPDTEIQLLTATAKSTPAGVTVEQLHVVAPAAGELSGAGSISPAQALDLRMQAKVRAISVPFSIQGTASSPVFKPEIKAMVAGTARKAAGSLLHRFVK